MWLLERFWNVMIKDEHLHNILKTFWEDYQKNATCREHKENVTKITPKNVTSYGY